MSSYQFTNYSFVLFFTTAIAATVAVALWDRRTAPGAIPLFFLELACAEWAFGIAFESAASTVELKHLWSAIAYLGTTAAPLCFFLFALGFSRHGRALSSRQIAALAVIPVLTVALAFTNPWHRLIWPRITIDPYTNLAVYGHGPYFWVFFIYSWVLLLLGVAILVQASFRLPRFYRGQVVTLLLASALPLLGNFLYVSGLTPIPGLDLTPFTFALTGLLLGWNMIRRQMFHLIPTARERVIECMTEAVLVIDSQGRLVDLNPSAQRLLGKAAEDVIGRPSIQALSRIPHLESLLAEDRANQQDLELTVAEKRLALHVQISRLRDHRGKINGRLLVLHDITRRRELEEEQRHLIAQLREALAEVKTLQGMLPICSSCKKIRDDQGYWQHVEVYVREHTGVVFSHGICPDCARRLYGELCPEDLASPSTDLLPDPTPPPSPTPSPVPS